MPDRAEPSARAREARDVRAGDRREAEAAARLAGARRRRAEASPQRAPPPSRCYRAAFGRPTSALRAQVLYDAHGQVWKDLARVQNELEAIRTEGQKSTGHAFVVFQRESRRDECLAVFYRPTMLDQLRNMLCGQVTIQPPQLRCAGNRLVFVEKAPEPADIFWEHLELSRGEKVGRDLARGRG